MLLLLSRFSRVRLCAAPWTAAHQAPPSTGFSRQEYWSGVPLPSPKNIHRQFQIIYQKTGFLGFFFFFEQSGWEIGYQVQFLFRVIERSVMMAKLLPTANPQVCFLKEVRGSGLFEGKANHLSLKNQVLIESLVKIHS